MAGFRIAAVESIQRWPARAVEFSHTRRARRISFALGIFLLVYGIVGFFAVPAVLRHVLTIQVAAALKRPVAVGRILFDPYRLQLEIDKLHVAERDGAAAFVDVGHIHLKASWASLFRMAAVIAEVRVDSPRINVVRTAAQKFNFSDLLEPSGAKPVAKTATPQAPPRFALSNILVRDGDIRFDDQVVGVTHEVAQIQLGVPFITSLPRDVDIYVQPLLAMVVDGSPLRIVGQSRPLSASRDTVLVLNLHALDLHRYLGYVPVKTAIKIPEGNFSCRLQVHFVEKKPAPVIAIAGRMAVDRLRVTDSANAPIVALGHLLVSLNDVEPLGGIFRIGEIRFDRLAPNLVMNPGGTTNLTALIGAGHKEPAHAQETPAAPAAQATATAAPPQSVVVAQSAQVTPAPSPPAPQPLEVTLDSLRIEDSSVHVVDNSGTAPAQLQLDKLHVLLQNFSLNGRWSAPFELSAALASGGKLAFKGGVDLADRKANTELAIEQLDLTALQGFAHSPIPAKLTGGKLDAKADVQATFAPGTPGVHVEPGDISVSDFALAAAGGHDQPLQWHKLSVQVAQVDLASRSATVREVRGDGLKLLVRRERGGKLNLLTMLQPPAAPLASHASQPRTAHRESNLAKSRSRKRTRRAPTKERKAKPAAVESAAAVKSAPWTFSVASVVLDKAEVQVTDEAAARPVSLQISPLKLRMNNVSSDFAKPIGVDLDATIGRRGAVKVAGTAAISPLRADLKVAMQGIDIAPADAYLTKDLNAKVASGSLSMAGVVRAEQTRRAVRGGYRGDLKLENLRILDRTTNQDFLRWQSLRLSRIDASGGGAGKPKARVGEIALANFDAGIILTADGKLNLKDITSRPGQAPASPPGAEATLQAQPSPSALATPAPAAQSAAVSTPAPLPADVEIGAINLSGGNVDYSDYFVKPNYSANLSAIEGQVGAFGTASSQPAAVELHGEVNGSAPLSIIGSVNPLAPMAFVDLTVKANGVELTGFSPYTTKYTGYPIERGTLTADVHYLLNQGELKADNHIVINQLTFGAKVENSTAINLPIRLAVAILKDRNGVIDLKVPVSGSLSDPQFSITSLVLHAFWNVIAKAATSPFSLIGAALGSKEDLSQVSFAPGYALLTPAAGQQLDTVANALAVRTNLKLNIQGCVDPAADREGLRAAAVDLAVREQKLKAAGGSGDPWEVKVAPDEYEKYLHRAYSAADFPKPRNFVGLAKSLPPEEMKKLMLANAKVTDADLSKLADARANAVRQYLAAKTDSSRLLVKPPNLDANTAGEGGGSARALLTLE